MDGSFTWEVCLATGTQARYGVKRHPMATVCMVEAEGETEYVQVPSALGRYLARMKKKGEACPTSKGEVLSLIKSVEGTVAWQQLVRMLERRDFSTADVSNKLKQQGFKSSVVREVVRRAEDCGFISNARFADSFVRGKLLCGWGMIRMEHELRKHGVDVKTLEGWPYDYMDPNNERARAIEVASRKAVRDPNRYAKMVRFLMGRGFSYGVATDAATTVLGERGE